MDQKLSKPQAEQHQKEQIGDLDINLFNGVKKIVKLYCFLRIKVMRL